MPPPGTADSGSDDPPSESSDSATLDSKTYLVMSGGEGYIDFRMGEFFVFAAWRSELRPTWTQRLFLPSGDESGELDGLPEPTESQQATPTRAERSHLIVWQVAVSNEWSRPRSWTPVCFRSISSFPRRKQLFLVHGFVQFKVYEIQEGVWSVAWRRIIGGKRVFRWWMLNCTSNKDGWREVVLKTWRILRGWSIYVFYSTRTTFTLVKPHIRPCLKFSYVCYVSASFGLFILCLFWGPAFKMVILCIEYFSKSQSSSVADKLAQ